MNVFSFRQFPVYLYFDVMPLWKSATHKGLGPIMPQRGSWRGILLFGHSFACSFATLHRGRILKFHMWNQDAKKKKKKKKKNTHFLFRFIRLVVQSYAPFRQT